MRRLEGSGLKILKLVANRVARFVRSRGIDDFSVSVFSTVNIQAKAWTECWLRFANGSSLSGGLTSGLEVVTRFIFVQTLLPQKPSATRSIPFLLTLTRLLLGKSGNSTFRYCSCFHCLQSQISRLGMFIKNSKYIGTEISNPLNPRKTEIIFPFGKLTCIHFNRGWRRLCSEDSMLPTQVIPHSIRHWLSSI